MSDKDIAIRALMQMIRDNEEKASREANLKTWFSGLNKDLYEAVESLRKGA